MVCLGKNIANCSRDYQFLPAICARTARRLHCPRAVQTRPQSLTLTNAVWKQTQYNKRDWVRRAAGGLRLSPKQNHGFARFSSTPTAL